MKKLSIKKVEIWWHDAFSYDKINKVEWLKEQLEIGNLNKNIGFLIGENKDWVAIAVNICDEFDAASGTWFIPKKWIIKRKLLK